MRSSYTESAVPTASRGRGTPRAQAPHASVIGLGLTLDVGPYWSQGVDESQGGGSTPTEGKGGNQSVKSTPTQVSGVRAGMPPTHRLEPTRQGPAMGDRVLC